MPDERLRVALRAALFLLGAFGLSGCLHRRPSPPPPVSAHPHYVLGNAYQAAGFWYYPAEDYGFDQTGIAELQPAGDELTADGEARDPGALTASMQTLQLPAIVEVTNLENGRQISVRVNDRGPASPGRLIALSPRAATLLAIGPAGIARVRVRIDSVQSHALVDQLGGGPRLAIKAAPASSITMETLPPPGGGPAGPARTLGTVPPQENAAAIPDRLPERIAMTYPRPGALYLQCGNFGRATYAQARAARLSGLGAGVVRSRDGRQTTYSVQVGPFATVAQADAALAQALRAGVLDARIRVQ